MRRLGIAAFMLAAVLVAYVAGAQVERASAIRIAPVDEAAMTPAQREMLGPSGTGPRTLQLFRICVRAPEMCRAWVTVTQSFSKLSMSLHDRELVILRTSFLCGNEYTWANHVAAGKRAGFSDDDLVRITKGPQAGWSGFEKTLLEATDALHKNQFIPDATWKALSSRYDDQKLQELIYLMAQYTFAAMWARSAGLPLEPGVPGFPR